MTTQSTLRNQRGFTLIEIIAVLVLLGILAAVAVPKFMNMHGDAQAKAVAGAIAAGSSNATMAYSSFLLSNGQPPTAIASNQWTGAAGTTAVTITTDLGDFDATYTYANPNVTVSISGGPSWLSTVAAGDKTKTFAITQ